MIPTLTTSRLVLRAPRVSDAELIAHYLNDFAVAGNLARVPFPYHLSDAEAWLRTRRLNMPVEETNFSIESKELGYIGHIGFHPGDKGPILGYWLGQPFWGQGFMSEAALATVGWFFEVTTMPVIYSGVFHFNAASLAIQHRLGFTETGRSSLLCLARSAQVEHIDTQLTRKRFLEEQASSIEAGSAAK